MTTSAPRAFDFPRPHDPFGSAPLSPGDEAALPEHAPFQPLRAVPADAPATAPPDYAADAGWSWHDAAIIAVGRAPETGAGEHFSIGVIDLYASARTGDLGGSYLELGRFDAIDQAAALYGALQGEVQARALPAFALPEYASAWAAEHAPGQDAPVWRSAGAAEYAAYEDVRALDARGLDGPQAETGWLPEAFPTRDTELLLPAEAPVNYAVTLSETDPWTTELSVEKVWSGGWDWRALAAYDTDDAGQMQQAQAARAALLETFRADGLEAMMQQAERTAVGAGLLQADRADGRLFRFGPADSFTSLREAELQRAADAPAPGSWDALVAQQGDAAPAAEGAAHYWQMHFRPVQTPDGQALGTALFVTEFPQLPADFEARMDAGGLDDSLYPTEARTLELAHFASETQARRFAAEFRAFVVPGVLDGPELAPEVAKLEGLSGEWEALDWRGITRLMAGDRAVVREANDWHLHDPQAEREAEMLVEPRRIDIEP